jgi:ubiquinone/menaquinone biosynthesis C-methylase UbiE
VDELEFRRDLYRGTAGYYDRFRVPYPQRLIDDLAQRTEVDGAGRLLDLACGPGLISFALHRHFPEIWAVDQEPDMIDVARQKAQAAGIGGIRFLTSAAEDLSAPEESFDLIAIGNAFHRLRRETVAASALRWLRPGGFLALLWGGSPWPGEAPWQLAMSVTMERWMTRVAAHGRVPSGYDRVREKRPDLAILDEAGFQLAGSSEFLVAHEWTPETIIGFVYSSSILPRAALGDLAPDFESDLQRDLRACEPSGRLRQTISFAYDLALRPV